MKTSPSSTEYVIPSTLPVSQATSVSSENEICLAKDARSIVEQTKGLLEKNLCTGMLQ